MSNRWMIGIAVMIVAVAGLGIVFFRAQPVAQTVQDISPAAYVSDLQSQPHFLLDVRTPEEFAEGHIASAANISVETLAANLQSVPRDVPVVVYCHSGRRAAQAAQILSDAGYATIYNLGGIAAWQAAGLPVEKS
jgi:rhodanese-related sulfurtransferase